MRFVNDPVGYEYGFYDDHENDIELDFNDDGITMADSMTGTYSTVLDKASSSAPQVQERSQQLYVAAALPTLRLKHGSLVSERRLK